MDPFRTLFDTLSGTVSGTVAAGYRMGGKAVIRSSDGRINSLWEKERISRVALKKMAAVK
jgi:hypothetical protein